MNEKLSFEEAVKRLDQIVREMEKGTLPLASAMTLYEEGIALIGQCSSLLEEAELKVTKLVQHQDGNLEEVPFEEN